MKIALIENNANVFEKVNSLFGESGKNFDLQKFDNCSSLIEKLEETYPNIILMTTADGEKLVSENLRKIKNIFPDIPVVITSNNGMSDSVIAALKVGAIGYCPAEIINESLINMITEATEGMAEMPEQLADLLASPMSGLKDKKLAKANTLFTTKELIILTLIKDKTSYDKIAVTLNTTVDKVKYQVRNIYRKLHSFYLSCEALPN